MAAFHFTAKIHSRSAGRNAVRAAAYRAAARLRNEREGGYDDFTRKADVVEAAIFAPPGSPGWVHERETLWNRVEHREKRRDAQVAQELEINLPRELSDEENWRLITDFCRAHLVEHGRVCDIAFHKAVASDGSTHPHAHVLMPTRYAEGESFGDKHPDVSWKSFTKKKDRLLELREVWADFSRRRALELGIDLGPSWTHLSFEDRGIDLEGQPKIGPKAKRLEREGSPSERTQTFLDTQRRNGAQLLVDPGIALEALTRTHATFSHAELARYIFTHTAPEQYEAALAGAQALAVSVGRDSKGIERFSSKAMVETEARMLANAAAMADRHRHALTGTARSLMRSGLSGEQRDAAEILLEGGDLACLIGFAGSGKSTMLSEVRQQLADAGYNVRGAALSGIAAQNLQTGSGIEARTLASLRYAWEDGNDRLTQTDVLVVDEAGMIGTRELDNLLAEARKTGAKVILVGDPEQLQAIESGAALRGVAERIGYAELTEIRRQQTDWQRQATRELATARTADGFNRYREAGAVEVALTDEDARHLLVRRWAERRALEPEASRIMLAHTKADTHLLNEAARAHMRAEGQLGQEITVETSFGERAFAAGERILFRRNERNLGVKNGTLGTVIGIEGGKLMVMTDTSHAVAVDPSGYQDFDHGYAINIHRAQGVTVDEAHALVTRGYDRHLAYVGFTRHHSKLDIVYSRESFGSEAHLLAMMGRERQKDLVMDYREREALSLPQAPDDSHARTLEIELETLRARNRQRLRDRGLTPF